MPPPPRLSARHPFNHLTVQELLLHAALGRDCFSSGDRNNFLALAGDISRLLSPCTVALAANSIPTGMPRRLAAAPRHVLYWRMLQEQERQQQQDGEEKVEERGPCATYSAPVYYDDVVAHQCCLERLLKPHGFQVALIGEMRRGCPVARQMTFLLTCDAPHNDCFPTEPKPEKDTNPPLLFTRAVKGLVASGYVKAAPKRSTPTCGRSMGRYVCLVERPSFGPEPFFSSGIGLQKMVLLWSPPHSFHVRRLFLTGPDPFVTHLMLLADARGYDLHYDGLYQQSRGACELALLRSEKDIFSRLEIPYVDPLHRYAYCRLHNLL